MNSMLCEKLNKISSQEETEGMGGELHHDTVDTLQFVKVLLWKITVILFHFATTKQYVR